MYEYKTTHGDLYHAAGRMHDESEPDDPVAPEGIGWELLAFAASSERLYWAWRRPSAKEGR